MKILPVSFDSFSVRSTFTIVRTSVTIYIDPSVAIAPKRYGLPPSNKELKELDKISNFIKENYKEADLFVITHYHWDHCPHPNSNHFDIFKSQKTFFIKDYNDTNKSQNLRAKRVIKKAKEINVNFDMKICDNKSFEFENTFISFSKSLWHGPRNSSLGKVVGVFIEYKNDSLFFASDVQGVIDDKDCKEIIKYNPKILFMSGPAIYHYKWEKKWTEISKENIKSIVLNTDIEKLVIDHHLLRDLNYNKFFKELRNFLEDYDVELLTAAEFAGKKIKLLEANRRDLVKNQF